MRALVRDKIVFASQKLKSIS